MAEACTRHEAREFLRSIPLFKSAGDDDLDLLVSHLIERRYPKDSVVVEEGLAGDYMYVIQEGRVKVTKASEDGREKIMDLFDEGDFFGEMSLLDCLPRSASVTTLEPSTLLALSRRDFLSMLRHSPDLALSIQYLSSTPWNDARYENAVLDGLILKARGQDLEGQKETYAEIQRILIDDVPRIVAAYQPWSYGIRTNLRGVAPHPLGFPLLQDGWFDD